MICGSLDVMNDKKPLFDRVNIEKSFLCIKIKQQDVWYVIERELKDSSKEESNKKLKADNVF